MIPPPKLPLKHILRQNYFYDLGGYAHRKTTKEQQGIQTEKISKALTHINADIYAICEIQKGDSAAEMLVRAMNERVKKARYAYEKSRFVAWLNTAKAVPSLPKIIS